MLRRWVKALGKLSATRSVLGWVMSQYIRLVLVTGRWDWQNREILSELEAKGTPIVLAFWHGRLFMMIATWAQQKVPFRMLVSTHRDGDIPTLAAKYYGIECIRGSSRHGGAGALRVMVKSLKTGHAVGFTPDGPRGPRMQAKGGVVSAAQLSGAVIVPVTFSAASARLFNTWDIFMVPGLFSRGVFRFGAPISVPRKLNDAEFEAKRQDVETALNDLTRACDTLMGRDPVLPDLSKASKEVLG